MSIDGSWKTVTDTPMGKQNGTLVLATEGSTVTGTLTGMETVDITDGVVDGNEVRFKASIAKPMALALEFTLTFDGDSLSGGVKAGAFGTSKITGSRA